MGYGNVTKNRLRSRTLLTEDLLYFYLIAMLWLIIILFSLIELICLVNCSVSGIRVNSPKGCVMMNKSESANLIALLRKVGKVERVSTS